MRIFLISCTFFAVLGVLDALLWMGYGASIYGDFFSLLELFWLAVSLFALVVAWQQGLVMLPAALFVFYQLVLWGAGAILVANSQQLGEKFVPPEWMLLAALIFYGGYFLLCRHYYSKEK